MNRQDGFNDHQDDSRTIKSGSKIHWGYVLTGALGASFGLGAIAIDVVNNYNYGSTEGQIAGFASVLFAGGLAVVPMVATKEGWTLTLRSVWWLCFLITGFCALNAYAAELASKIDHSENSNLRYQDARTALEDAKAERDAARTEAQTTAALEAAPSEALEALLADAKSLAEKEGSKKRGGCSTKCEAAEKNAKLLAERIALAKTREAAIERAKAAQTRMDAAKVDSATGHQEVSLLADLVAKQINGDTAKVAKQIGLAKSLLFILGTLLFAALIDPSLNMIIKGFGWSEKELQTEAPVVEESTVDLADGDQVTLWADLYVSARAGEMILAKDVLAHFELWCQSTKAPVITGNAFARAMTKLGYTKVKKGGKMYYQGVQLRKKVGLKLVG